MQQNCNKKNIRNTKSKEKVLNILQESTKALALSEISEMLKGDCDRVTVYRILNRLLEEGKAHSIADDNGVMCYAFCKNCEPQIHKHKHVHFQCKKCSELICINEVDIPKISLPESYVITDIKVLATGLCNKCNSNYQS